MRQTEKNIFIFFLKKTTNLFTKFFFQCFIDFKKTNNLYQFLYMLRNHNFLNIYSRNSRYFSNNFQSKKKKLIIIVFMIILYLQSSNVERCLFFSENKNQIMIFLLFVLKFIEFSFFFFGFLKFFFVLFF